MSTLLDVLFDDALVGRCLAAPDGRVRRANVEWVRATGLSLDEVLGADVASLFPERRDEALAMIARARRGHVDLPRHARRIAGRETWWDRALDPIPMEDGVGLLLTAREVRAAGAPPGDGRRPELVSFRTLASVVENSGEFIGICSLDLKPTFVNDAGRRMVGLGDRDVGDTHVLDYFWPDDRPRIEREAVPALLRDGRWSGAVRFRNFATGAPIHTLWNAFTIRDEAGAPIAYATVSPNLDEIRGAEEALRVTADRLRRLIDANPIGVVEGDAAGRIVDANDAYLRIIGRTREELRAGAIRWDLITPEEHLARDERAIAEARDHGVSSVYEKEYVRADGGRVPVLVACARFGDAGELVAFVVDITARTNAEHALRESEDRARLRAAELEAVLDTVPAAVWISRDPRGDRIDANSFGAELLRSRPGENVSISAPGADRPRHFSVRADGRELADDELPVQRAARFGEMVRGAELELTFDDGETRHLLGNATPLYDVGGLIKGSVGAFIDVTDRRRAELAVREADRRKTEFLAVLSHELRNPLAAIRNAIALLDTAAPEGDGAGRAKEILRRQTDHLVRLVDDLLDLSRIAHGKLVVRLARADARELVRRAYLDAQGLFDARGVELCLSGDEEPLWIEADAARFSQMMGNLLHNALKFTPRLGRVRITLRRRGAHCEVSVEDTGQGLDRADLERIFDPFEQATQPRGEAGGLGLGLALVKRLATKHHGTVRAHSDGPGQGSRFTLELPLIAPPPPAPADVARSPSGRRAAPMTIVVVEDNEDAAATLAELLTIGGHRVTTASTGEAGVKAVATQRPEVVICDVGLPDMSGYDVIRAIRAADDGRCVFAVALTGYAQPQDRAALLTAGFDAHLPKPTPLDELDRLLRGVAETTHAG